MTVAERVLQRLRGIDLPLRPAELAQMVDAPLAEITEALCELEAEGLVEPVEWRAVRERAA